MFIQTYIVFKASIFSVHAFPGNWTHDRGSTSWATRTNPFTTTSLTTNKLNECMIITIWHQVEKQGGGKRERQGERESHLLTLFLLSLPFHQDKFKRWDKDISFSISLFPCLPLSRFLSSADVFQTQQYRKRDRQKDMGWAGGSNLELLSFSSTIVLSVDKGLHSFLLQSPTHSSYSSKAAVKQTEHIRNGRYKHMGWYEDTGITKWLAITSSQMYFGPL